MGIQISPFGNTQFLTPSGAPAIGYQLFVYAGRSTSKLAAYTDADGVGLHPNPILLDANGFAPLPIYIKTNTAYKFVLALPDDLDPPTMPIYPVDQVIVGLETPPVNTPEWSAGTTPTYLSATQFSVTGNQTAIYHTGRRVKCVLSSGSLYGTITGSGFTSVTTVTVQLDTGALTNTLSAVWYSFLSALGSSWPGGFTTGTGTTFTGPVTMPAFSAFTLLPAGLIVPYAGTSPPPTGYLLCNGADYNRLTYAALFARIGTVFGAGNGVDTFNVPNIANLAANIPYIIRHS